MSASGHDPPGTDPDGLVSGAGRDPYVALAETHTGAVVFVGDVAYKLKKPVSLGFVDWTDLADRVRAVRTELELNRRLSPDVYLGTTRWWRPDGPGEPVLVMRRLPADRRLSALVAAGDPDLPAVIDDLARLLAGFHATAARSELADEVAGAAATLERWETNHRRMFPAAARWIDEGAAARAVEEARRYITGREPLFAARVADGRARDGHGDLLADDVFCLPDGPRVLDCLDFDPRLRAGDTLADVAFLAMDLERLGRGDLGWRLLEEHRRLTGDTWPVSLAHHHVAYRAQVRTLVAVVRADQGDPRAPGVARDLLGLTLAHLDAARIRVVLVGGIPGSGKSTLAAGLARALGAEVLRSDVIRKELAGLAPDERAPSAPGEGLYTPEWGARTYAELIDRAARRVAMGVPVVLDATWADAGHRATARAMAAAHHAEVVELRCVVDVPVARRRVAERAAGGADVSDADEAVTDALAGTFAPWPEAVPVDTSGDPADALRAALVAVGLPGAGGGSGGPSPRDPVPGTG